MAESRIESEQQTGTGDRVERGPGDARRTCLIVLGMHRSGTSALARVLNLLGASLPNRMLGAESGKRSGSLGADPSDRI